MKTASRNLIFSSVIASLFLPNLVFAQPNESGSASSNGQHQKPAKVQPAEVCVNITNVTAPILNETDARFTKMQNSFSKRNTDLKEKFAASEAKRDAARATMDVKRQKNFDALEKKVTGDTQKQAVSNFESAVKLAVSSRRAAVDVAEKSFHDKYMDIVMARQSQLRVAAENYRASITSATAAAKASCSAGVAPATVRSNLQSALKTNRENLKAAIGAAGKNKPQLDALMATRKAAIAKANADMKASIDAALATLKSALHTSAKPK